MPKTKYAAILHKDKKTTSKEHRAITKQIKRQRKMGMLANHHGHCIN